MKLDLWEVAKSADKQHAKVTISERLPSFINEPCEVAVTYQVKIVDDYYLINMETSANLDIHCERCSEMFNTDYHNHLELAICETDVRAEALAYHYESLTSPDGTVDLEDLLVDELYLYAPRCHANEEECAKTLEGYLIKKA